MPSITQPFRHRIDAAAYELIAIAEELLPADPALAEMYMALGRGIESTHYTKSGEHHFGFNIPIDCSVQTASGSPAGPTTVSVIVRSAPA